MRSFIAPEQFPYETTTGWTYDSGNYAETMRVAMEIAGYEELRREQAEKRARGELMGIGVSFFTEGVGAGPRKHMDILGLAMNDGADLRVHPSGKAVVSISAQTQGQGHETTFAQIVAEELGIPPEDVEVRHGDTDKLAVRARHLRQPLDAGLRRRGRGRLAQGARQGPPDRGDDARDEAGGSRLGEGPLVRQGRPREGRDDRGDRGAGLQRRADARRDGGRARRTGDLRPAEPHLPLRRLHRRRRHRPRHGPRHGPALHRGRRLRRPHQPDDRRRPDPRRPRRGRRHRADGGHHASTRRATASTRRSWTT